MVDKKSEPKTSAQVVAAARDPQKVTGLEIIHSLIDNFMELHGDREHGDDPAIIGGIGLFHGQPVTVITTDKGTGAEERAAKHFGCPTPSGYRKALRLMKAAAKFRRPVITFVNTPGAYPGQSAEENGQGDAIAQNLLEISRLKTPVLTVILGEGGSGGALALACGDAVWMLENSTYSILSPEGFAAILWKDQRRSNEAAELMRLTPPDLLDQKVIDGIIAEPADHQEVIANINQTLWPALQRFERLPEDELIARRHERYRKF
jgi:acetyl-CoA carboxylase carboxyl transferase alpha subunit